MEERYGILIRVDDRHSFYTYKIGDDKYKKDIFTPITYLKTGQPVIINVECSGNCVNYKFIDINDCDIDFVYDLFINSFDVSNDMKRIFIQNKREYKLSIIV
jgi:hypothetical protein